MPRRYYPPTESDIPLHGWVPYSDIHRERIRAHAKHDGNGHSMERADRDDDRFLSVIVEEVGEIAKAINERDSWDHVRSELVQVAAMCTAWIDAIDGSYYEAEHYGDR